MNIIWLFLGALVISIGWFTGMRITQKLDEVVWKAIYNSKVVKECRNKKREIDYKKSCKHGRYHETKMGF